MTMEMLRALRLYGEAAALLAVGAALFAACLFLATRAKRAAARSWLRLGQCCFVAALALPLAASLLPRDLPWKPTEQVFSESSNRLPRAPAVLAATRAAASGAGPRFLRSPEGLLAIVVLLALGVGAGLARFAASLGKLKALAESMPAAKRIGRVVVLVSDVIPAPISFWLWPRAYVVLPAQMLDRPDDWRIALRHEIQHHRQRDTLWAQAIELTKAFFFWNPAIYAWARLLAHAQEFACDEILVDRRKIAPQAYGGCLLRAAESTVRGRAIPAGTTGMAATSSGHLLKRRLTMMAKYGRTGVSRLPLILGAGTLLFMATAALAAHSVVRDRELTLAEAKALAMSARDTGEIPLNMNELVLRQLNRFVGTPEGRERISRALDRYQGYKIMVQAKIGQYKLPRDLAAVPILESGYKNFKPPQALGAGLWGFVKGTARRYGLVVTEAVDERLDPEKETDAAMRYFRDLFDTFHDWRLALKAYNEGENRVKFLIEELGTSDPWTIEMKLEGGEQYLAKMTALLIIVRNPGLVE